MADRLKSNQYNKSTRFEEPSEMEGTRQRVSKDDPKAQPKKSSRKQSKTLSRSASERSVDTELAEISADTAVPKAHRLARFGVTVNWYKLTMGAFFVIVAVLMGLLRLGLAAVQTDTPADIDFSLRKNLAYEGSLVWGWIVTQVYYQANGFIMGLFDLLLIYFGITLVLDDDQKDVVAASTSFIQDTARRVGVVKLRDPKNEARKEIEKAQSIINKIVGGRRFKIRIMRIEAVKEVLSLDLVHHIIFHFFRLLVKFFSPLPNNYSPQLDLFFEGILLCFLHFKNIVYLAHRIGERPELSKQRKVAVFASLLLLLLRLTSLFEFFLQARDLTLGLAMVCVSYGGYRLADYLNDRHFLNSTRNHIFLSAGFYN